jgi:uncharacterized repeat protein (TIGR03847 family)
MPRFEMDLNPVSSITTDAIGKPGERVFYLQGRQEEKVVTLLIEKIQIQSLAVGVEQFLDEINKKYPDLPDAGTDYLESQMHIEPPVDPLFRVGEIGLGYDQDNDLMVLVAREATTEGSDPEEGGVVRFWCSRSQLRALINWGMEVASHGRPLCPQCGEPMDPEGHFCPKKNGHKK